MKAKEVLRLLQITRPTLTKYVKTGIIKVDSEINGQYTYNSDSVYYLLNKNSNIVRKNVIYCRVSSNNQKQDLCNQEDTVAQFCANNEIIVHEVYKDIASGMNLDRKEFLILLDKVVKYEIATIYITYKDRLARLSFEMVQNICNNFGTKIVILNEIGNSKTVEQEFLEEVVSLIHSFSMKMYSKRRKAKLELIAKDLSLEQESLDE